MATTADFRNGMVIELGEALFTIVEFQHVKPGKGGAFVRTKLKNMRTGAVLEKTFRSGERIIEARIERQAVQFLYRSDDIYYVMDTTTFEQFPLSLDIIGEKAEYLMESMTFTLLKHEENVFGIEIPIFVVLEVKETEPGVKGDTAQGGSKPATMETGLVIQVPLFVNIGDKIRIDTRTCEYIERA